jgi:hypothetical protein
MSHYKPYDRERDEPAEMRLAAERDEWSALVAADTLNQLPPEALIASVKHLAHRLLELTGP